MTKKYVTPNYISTELFNNKAMFAIAKWIPLVSSEHGASPSQLACGDHFGCYS